MKRKLRPIPRLAAMMILRLKLVPNQEVCLVDSEILRAKPMARLMALEVVLMVLLAVLMVLLVVLMVVPPVVSVLLQLAAPVMVLTPKPKTQPTTMTSKSRIRKVLLPNQQANPTMQHHQVPNQIRRMMASQKEQKLTITSTWMRCAKLILTSHQQKFQSSKLLNFAIQLCSWECDFQEL